MNDDGDGDWCVCAYMRVEIWRAGKARGEEEEGDEDRDEVVFSFNIPLSGEIPELVARSRPQVQMGRSGPILSCLATWAHYYADAELGRSGQSWYPRSGWNWNQRSCGLRVSGQRGQSGLNGQIRRDRITRFECRFARLSVG